MLKLKFDSNQEYQQKAISSIVDVFEGQTQVNSKFTIARLSRTQMSLNQYGIGNKLELDNEDLFKNVIKIQDRNHLPRSKNIIDENYKIPNFTVEMETGTGKTYVYTRTIIELHKKYGFSKFIIVVPSVAIREGVYKSLEITKEHFKSIYDGTYYNFFKYESSKPTQARDFAESDSIEIMIINIDAFRKGVEDNEKGKQTKTNLFFRENEKLQWRKPIDFITETKPIVLIDEPQSVDNTPKSKDAIHALNPLFVLRYSATHKEKYNLLYRLGPVEAYEEKLVKKIEVLSVTGEGDNNTPYLKLLSVSDSNGYKAKIEIDKIKNGIVKRQGVQANPNKKNNLYLLSGERDVYKGYIIEGINCYKGQESVEFEGGRILMLNGTWGDVDDLEIKRSQIRGTIYAHLDKELILLDKGIKVISLFFIDKVDNYRIYKSEGRGEKGVYAKIFEEEYERIIKEPKYNSLLVSNKFKSLLLNDVGSVHDGYFAKDNNGKYKESTERGNSEDESAYGLIMKDKERLLSFETPLRFIFSHSALKEGWDNPNVFQICTLVETIDTFTKRQKIGRGLRLPVNQEGERILDEQINILTVVANESYEDFADRLQKEMESETGVKFGILEPQMFASIIQTNSETNKKEEIGPIKSEQIFNYFVKKGYINGKGKVENKLKEDIVNDKFELPEEFNESKPEVISKIKQVIKKLPVFNKNDRVEVKINKQVFESKKFNELWDKVKYKTYYNIQFDANSFKENCIKDIQKMEKIPLSKLLLKFVRLNIEQSGITTQDPYRTKRVELKGYEDNLPDVVRIIEEATGLKRKTIANILIQSKRLDDFMNNPQAFIEQVIEIIKDNKRKKIVDGIKYQRIGDDYFYSQQLFEDKELIASFTNNTVPVSKSIYTHTVYDSDVEKVFTERMSNNDDIKLFIKLPSWFTISTPLGNYNPDFAILYEKNGIQKLYFVIETKGSSKQIDLKMKENERITCAREHFKCLGGGVRYDVVSDFEEFEKKV